MNTKNFFGSREGGDGVGIGVGAGGGVAEEGGAAVGKTAACEGLAFGAGACPAVAEGELCEVGVFFGVTGEDAGDRFGVGERAGRGVVPPGDASGEGEGLEGDTDGVSLASEIGAEELVGMEDGTASPSRETGITKRNAAKPVRRISARIPMMARRFFIEVESLADMPLLLPAGPK